MAEEEPDTLKIYWDHFFKAETGTYEKSTWLDLFLAEFLIRINDGANPKELINFCPVSGVVTLVGCELLCGIHRVTSSISTHYVAPLPGLEAATPLESNNHFEQYTNHDTQITQQDEEAKPEEARVQPTSLFSRNNALSSEEILRKYILGGVVWKCLVLLKALGVEGLSCCRQLSSVLVWVVGELGGARACSPPALSAAPAPAAPAPAAPAAPTAPALRTPIHHLFSHKIWSKQKPNSPSSKNNSAHSSDRTPVPGRSRHFNQLKLDSSDIKTKRRTKHSEQSSESGDSNDDLLILNRSLTIKVCSPSDDFEYFDSPIKSLNEYPHDTYYPDPYHSPRKAKAKADDYMNDKHREIINSEITTYEFTLIITDLLQELCKAESSLSGSEGSQISVQCINFSLRNLCSLQFSSLPAQSEQNNTQQVSRIKVALTELLIVSLDKVLIHSDLCAKLINNGILPMLLRILEDIISKSSNVSKPDTNNRDKHIQIDKTESENLLKFVFGIAYSITAFFYCLLMQCRSVDKLREFTDQFKLYGECLKGGLLKECIELMIRTPGVHEDETVTLIKKLIESIGKIVNGMKRVRSEVTHSAACSRTRHKACRVRVACGMHHHHDILGEASAGLPRAASCCISLLYGTLTSLLTDDLIAAQSILRHKILKVMLNCGVCCCFSPGLLMESIVRLMLTHSSVAAVCLQVLEQTVYGELGASVLVARAVPGDRLPCAVCEPADDRPQARKLCSHAVSPVERKNLWSFLIHYNSLLQLDNHNNVLHATVSHLLKVTPKCRTEMKYELLFSVIYPTFIVAKHRYIIRLEESARFLTVSCLNIFASLLNTVSFAEQFIQKGGLSYVLELVSLSEFSNQCCSILEIAIIVEILKLMTDNSELTYYREMSSLASVQMLFKSLSEMTSKCYKIYKLKLPEDTFEELCDVTKERDALAIMPPVAGQGKKVSTPQSIRSGFTNERYTEETIEDHISVLNNIWTFWKTCAGLCLYSPMFREYVVSESAFLDSYALIKLLLYYLCNCECGVPEMRVLIKIIEALLTVQFSVADVTSGRSKETSCGLVRGALAAVAGDSGGPAGGAALESGGLRALCEALIRVAAAQPSPKHAMPRLTHAKVPPLECQSGGSSAECSSSEDSAAAPYASDHSDPHDTRPDDGYEADVEVTGKLELLSAPYKTRKLSGSLATVGNTIEPAPLSPPSEAEAMSTECVEYTKNGELAHPELCIIVVDILTQLIHKLVNSKEGSEVCVGGLHRVGVEVARACCARLAGAAARARPPPPLLLRRLLAPPASHLLSHTHTHLQELQTSILELVQVLGAQALEPPELGALLRLFAARRPPLAPLLATLRRLLAAATHNTPDCILSFPIPYHAEETKPSLEEVHHLTATNTSQSYQAENIAKKLQDAHYRAGIRSCWSSGAVRCGLEGAGWAPWLAGFALALWLHRDHTRLHTDDEKSEFHEESGEEPAPRSPRPSELLHLMSVGHDSLMFELWIDTATGGICVRLTRPESNANRVVSEARLAAAVPPGPHTALALNVRELVRKRHIYVQVTMFVNGVESETVCLPVQGIMVRKATPVNVLVGHAGGPGGRPGGPGASGAFHLASAAVYRAPMLTAYTALHLTAHGPDSSCMVRCESPNFPIVLTPNVLDSNIDWDQVYEISSATLRDLHENLLLSFSAHTPHIMNLYHQTAPPPTVFAGRVPTTAGLMAGAGASAASGASGGGRVPEALYTHWSGAPLPSAHRGLGPALYMLGGPDTLLYLYARVVELEGTAEQQATALGILLRACRLDNRLYQMFYGDESLDMLLTVFASPKCRITHHTLKVILEEACSASVLSVCGEEVTVGARGACAVLEPALLLLLARAWRHLDTPLEVRWSGGGETVWSLALGCLSALLAPSQPRRAFNHYQMNRLGLMDHLLLACKERFLNSDCGPLEPGASRYLVEVVRGLMGAPPSLPHLAALGDFLLLMHQASDTFVTHSRANFYFLLTAETQETSEFAINSARRRTSKRTRKKDVSRGSVSSASTDEVQPDGAEDKMDSSLDSTKQLKGIINMHIKEGRKHTVSSTSDNSDNNMEQQETDRASSRTDESSERADEQMSERTAEQTSERTDEQTSERTETAEGTQELADYVVVDADDVDHTTVEMYSSGIYHQKRVRAGAAAECSTREALLGVLRDALAVLPDSALAQAVCGAVQAESLAVLGNQRSGGARAALVRVVAALQRRAPPDLARALTQRHYYTHLANQISLYEGSWDLATACAMLLTKCDVPLEDQLDEDIWVEGREDWAGRAAPLLALLPRCLGDVPLAHNLTLILRRLIDKISLKAISEISIVEVVVRSISAVGAREEWWEGRALLLDDLAELLHRVARRALAAPHAMQSVLEIHHMLTFVEWSAEGGGGAARAAHEAQAALFAAQLDYLEDRLHSAYTTHAKPTNYFTVLSAAVSGEGGAEMCSRHQACVLRALSFLLTHSPARPQPSDVPLFDRLLATFLQGGQCGGTGRGVRWWAGSGEWAGGLQELVWWAARAPVLQPRLLRALYAAPAPALAALSPPDPPALRKLAVYLLMVLKQVHGSAEEGGAAVELAITDWARSWALAVQAGLPARLPSDTLAPEAAALARADLLRWAHQAQRARPAIAKVVFSKDSLAQKVTETAMGITRQVVDVQNGERKSFMEHLRRNHSRQAAAAARWHRLIATHTHEQGIWHDPSSYPASWQLDPTEGPGRVRVRLRRAHLNIHPRFLKPQHRYKAERAMRGGPLRSVVGGWGALRGGLVARLQLNETVSYMARVTYVTVDNDTGGELLLSDRSIHFVPEERSPEDAKSQGREGLSVEEESMAVSWPLESLLQVATRRWCLQERAVELFLSSGHAHLLAFSDVAERAAFLKALAATHLPAKIEPDSLSDAMSAWRSGAISNWEYLMRLNGLAGRTYNDLMQYPVLPFVLADYCSRILNLTDPASFRDLTKPMAVQNKNREQHYINIYNDLCAARREGCSALVSRQPHHYASLYSNSGGVLHYLVRLPPFTELFLNYQDNNFDMPDRTFHSLATTWRLITNDSPTDVKELIPELFYLPELFHNNEGLELGARQCGASVDSVELAAWAPDARLFTLAHRQALEAPLVTDALPHWIDLVFGYKQTGQHAIDAINVFPACTYYGFDPLALEDEVDRTAAAAMVRTYGQAPRQLLRTPHPHAAHDLVPAHTHQVPVWSGVEGARWGKFCGSPELGAVRVAARRVVPGAGAIHALPASRHFAAAPPAARLLALPAHSHVEATSANGQNGVQQGSLALLSWGHSDNIMRLKRRRDARPDLLLYIPAVDPITCVSTWCGGGGCAWAAFVGHASGRVVALRAAGGAGGGLRARSRPLLAHRRPLAALHVCARAGLLASASQDGAIVLWDLNKLSYIRTLPNRDMLPVTHVTISETLCDVASVHDVTSPARADADRGDVTHHPEDNNSYEKDSYKYKSLIRVHTVNASFVGSVKVSETVTSVCYSCAPEGLSVNVVAVGLRGGGVRLYSSWDLRPVLSLPPVTHLPLVSLTYSNDSQLLCGCYEDGTVVAWESGAGRSPPVRIVPAHALF